MTVLGYCFLVGEGHWSQFRLSFDDITLLFKETCCSFSPSIIPSLPYPNPILPETPPPILQAPPQTPITTSRTTTTTIPSCFRTLSNPPPYPLLPLTHLKHQKNANPRKRRKQPLLQPPPPPPPGKTTSPPFFRQPRLASQAPNMRALWGELFACCWRRRWVCRV